MAERVDPLFLGYGLKHVLSRPDWLDCASVEHVSSVSRCISTEPYTDERFKRWAFNASGWYDTPELAQLDVIAAVPCRMFAYALFSFEFEGEAMRHVSVGMLLSTDTRRLPAGPNPGFAFLGYDVVSGRCGGRQNAASAGLAPVMAGFDCSPLSCNSMAREHPVNRHCLLDHWDDAVAAATRFAKEEPEPGPYYIFAVYADTSDVPRCEQ